MTKTKQYVLPIFAIVASIVILTIPSALAAPADYQPTTAELERAIRLLEIKISTLQASQASAYAIIDERLISIATHQVVLDRLDAIVESGGVLTPDQITLYDATVAEIDRLEKDNATSSGRIISWDRDIDALRATIAQIQAMIDSRA